MAAELFLSQDCPVFPPPSLKPKNTAATFVEIFGGASAAPGDVPECVERRGGVGAAPDRAEASRVVVGPAPNIKY